MDFCSQQGIHGRSFKVRSRLHPVPHLHPIQGIVIGASQVVGLDAHKEQEPRGRCSGEQGGTGPSGQPVQANGTAGGAARQQQQAAKEGAVLGRPEDVA